MVKTPASESHIMIMLSPIKRVRTIKSCQKSRGTHNYFRGPYLDPSTKAVHGVMSTQLCIRLRCRSRLGGFFFRWAESVELSRRCSFGRYFQHSISDVIAALIAMSMTRV